MRSTNNATKFEMELYVHIGLNQGYGVGAQPILESWSRSQNFDVLEQELEIWVPVPQP